MIELELYRSRIGCFSKEGCKRCHCRKKNKSMGFSSRHTPAGNLWLIFKSVCVLFYVNFLCIIMAMNTELTKKTYQNNSNDKKYIDLTMSSNPNNTILESLLNLAILIMIGYIFKIFIVDKASGRTRTYSTLEFICIYKKMGKFSFFSLFVVWNAMLNLSLIVINQPAIVNPGPTTPSPPRLSVLYLNAQGLYSPGNKHFFLNKFLSFQAYVFKNKPDVVVVNETWFTKDVHDNEIFPNSSYKVFRLDRSAKTHPYDENNPSKFRKCGGGVLIAVRADLDVESKSIKFKKFSCKAELLSIDLKFPNGSHKCILYIHVLSNWYTSGGKLYPI